MIRVRNLKFAKNLKFATSKTLVNFMKKMMFLSHNWYFSVQKALIYYTFNKSHHNSFILLAFSHVANFRFLTLHIDGDPDHCLDKLELYKGFFVIALISNSVGVGPLRRYALFK